MAQISWYKDGRKIGMKDTTLINDEKQCSSSINGYYFKLKNGHRNLSDLIICDVNVKKNNGTYSCVATNKLGSTRAADSLNVYCKYFILKSACGWSCDQHVIIIIIINAIMHYIK